MSAGLRQIEGKPLAFGLRGGKRRVIDCDHHERCILYGTYMQRMFWSMNQKIPLAFEARRVMAVESVPRTE